jgi:D-alanyl-D-alanine carboxypeptidase/D-alanyl-D-alanine-endopeptidase (penicillin-binding protein 4)
MLVADADGTRPPRLAWRTQVPVNPASIMKLVTTYAALDLLGAAYSWTTPVYVDGTVSNGVLNGNLYIKGQGDPKLVLERVWLLLRHVQGLGITTVSGDIVLDRSAFENTSRTTRAPSTASRCGPTTPRPMRCWSTSSRST